jgi:glycosyltransferase involved in cell wall biosynthesis
MKKFNLIQVVPSLQSGGVEQGTIDVANYLAETEIKNYIASSGGQMLSLLSKKYVKHYTMPVHSKNFLLMPIVARKINKIINENNINILHIRSRAPAWLLPYINKEKLKTVSTFHNVYGHHNIIKKFYSRQLSNVDKIVAISKYVKDEIVKNYQINQDKIIVINRGIDVNFLNADIDDQKNYIYFINKHKINMQNKIILFPGRLTEWKGQLEFLKIAEYFKDKPMVFYFVGDDKNTSYLKKLNQEIIKKNLNHNCCILGHLNKNELKIMYKCSDIVISAPLKPEGFCRIISETLSMKKMILAYHFGGAKNQLDGLDSIYKIMPQDFNEMKKKIINVLQLTESQIDNMGAVARKHVVNKFSKEKMLSSYVNFYEAL